MKIPVVWEFSVKAHVVVCARPIMVDVEIEFTIRHSLEELKDKFIIQGYFPEWRMLRTAKSDGTHEHHFLETRTIGVVLHNETERRAWFVFSMEAYGELKRKVTVPTIIPSSLNIDDLDLEPFLNLCRECLVDYPIP